MRPESKILRTVRITERMILVKMLGLSLASFLLMWCN
jgi:hypothetical protein